MRFVKITSAVTMDGQPNGIAVPGTTVKVDADMAEDLERRGMAEPAEPEAAGADAPGEPEPEPEAAPDPEPAADPAPEAQPTKGTKTK